jgi:hypothetical protein
VDEHEGLVELDLHVLGVGHEVRREVPAVELHALDDGDVSLEALALFDGDHAVLAHLLERVGHDLAGLGVVVGGDGGDVLDVLLAVDGGGCVVDRLVGDLDGLLHPADERVGVDARGDVAEPLLEECLSEDGRGRGAVAGVVGGLGGRFLHELGAHILGLVGQLDLFGDRDAVLGHGRAAPGLVDDRVAPTWAEGHFDGRGEFLNPGQEGLTGFDVESQFFGCHLYASPLSEISEPGDRHRPGGCVSSRHESAPSAWDVGQSSCQSGRCASPESPSIRPKPPDSRCLGP